MNAIMRVIVGAMLLVPVNTAAIAWSKTGTLYEYACHEDNYAMYGILLGARTEERQPGKE